MSLRTLKDVTSAVDVAEPGFAGDDASFDDEDMRGPGPFDDYASEQL
jgi:hypothetical protein